MVKTKKVRWSMILSHHPPSQYCRTYKIAGIRLCARCLGIPVGFILNILFFSIIPYYILFMLPIPTFLNFLLQELKLIRSINFLKTILTIFLGIYLFENLSFFISGNYLIGVSMLIYLVVIEFIIAKILDNNGKLETLISEYENGVYIENHTQQNV